MSDELPIIDALKASVSDEAYHEWQRRNEAPTVYSEPGDAPQTESQLKEWLMELTALPTTSTLSASSPRFHVQKVAAEALHTITSLETKLATAEQTVKDLTEERDNAWDNEVQSSKSHHDEIDRLIAERDALRAENAALLRVLNLYRPLLEKFIAAARQVAEEETSHYSTPGLVALTDTLTEAATALQAGKPDTEERT